MDQTLQHYQTSWGHWGVLKPAFQTQMTVIYFEKWPNFLGRGCVRWLEITNTSRTLVHVDTRADSFNREAGQRSDSNCHFDSSDGEPINVWHLLLFDGETFHFKQRPVAEVLHKAHSNTKGAWKYKGQWCLHCLKCADLYFCIGDHKWVSALE